MTTIHDLTALSHKEAYDRTQTDAAIKKGDFLRVAGGIAVMFGAWPTMIVGTSTELHEFSEDAQDEKAEALARFNSLVTAAATSYTCDVSLVSTKGNKFEIDTTAQYGYWEFRDGGEGGGLWFSRLADGRLELTDMDGASVLPQSIVDKLRAEGYVVDESFDSENRQAYRGAVLPKVEALLTDVALPGYQDLVDALRAAYRLLDGSQPKDAPGACMVIGAALARLPAGEAV